MSRMGHKALILVHLLGFAAYLGAGFAQQQFMKRSSAAALAGALRDEYERLAAQIVTRIELPALLTQLLSGIGFLIMTPAWLHQPWLHGKLTCVVALLVLSHAEMFNARKIVKARASQGDAAGQEIAARKKRHELMGAVGSLAVVVLMALVAQGTG